MHCIFPPPQITGHTGEDPISLKKLKDGDGLWDYRKVILGWIFDGIERSIQLPTEKIKQILIELKKNSSIQKHPAPKIPTNSRKVKTCRSRYPNRKSLIHTRIWFQGSWGNWHFVKILEHDRAYFVHDFRIILI